MSTLIMKNIMQSFHQYLDTNQNWIYRLLVNIKNFKIYIISRQFVKCDFYNSKFHYFKLPIVNSRFNRNKVKGRIFNRLIRLGINRIYNSYFRFCIKRYKVKLIHSHFAFTGWFDFIISQGLNVKRVVSYYGLDYEYLPYKNPIWKKHYEILFKNVDCFLCEGSHGANILKEMGCREDKIKILHLGVDIDKVPYFNRVKNPNSLKIVQISYYNEKKGQSYSLQAFLKALKVCPNMTLTFVGEDDTIIARRNLQRLVKELGVDNKVFFLDQIPFSTLYNFMSDYQVLMQPSLYSESKNCEGGAPVILLDAQATGMPIISTFHCDIPEEVIHQRTGLLSPEKDVIQIAEKIKQFYLMNQSDYDNFSKAAREHIIQKYNLKESVKQLASIYEELLDGKK